MNAETVAVCAALYTGLVWGAGALSTWLAVKPMRQKLEMLEAWRDRVAELARQDRDNISGWADRVETTLASQTEVLRTHQDYLQGLRENALAQGERLAGVEDLARRLWFESHPEYLLRPPAQKGSGQAAAEDFSPKGQA